MSLKSSRVAGFLSSLLLTSTTVAACFAQPAYNFDRVASCTDDADNNEIKISTIKGAPLNAPSIQYLPGPNGHAMMVADFSGLSYMMPPHIIHPVQTPGKWGIEEIRVGQFQVNPPICRIAAISRNPASLKGLSFTSNSGMLIVKWTGAKGLIPDPVETAVAPAKVEDTKATLPPKVETGSDTKTTAARNSKTVIAKEPKAADVKKIATIDSSQTASKIPAKSKSSDTSTSAPKPVADATPDTTAPTTPNAKSNARPSGKAASEDDDLDRGIQHIQDLIDAARRSKIVPGKVQAHQTAQKADSATLRDSVVSLKDTPATAKAKVPTAKNNSAAAKDGDAPTRTETTPDTPPNRTQPAAVATVPASERNNKLLTTPSQDQADATDTIKKPVPTVAAPVAKNPDDAAVEPSETADLPNKEKSDNLRAEKKNEKPPGVPMARLSVVSDTGSSEPNAAIQILSERNITYKSFRLHAPERYIIDLEKPADLDEATVSTFQDNALCRSVRIGMTDKRTCRLVFDLASESVQVQEKTFEEDGRVLTLKIFNQAPSVTMKSGLPLEGVSLVLDAGHGGSDPGAQRGDAREKEMTLGIINQLKKRLEANGAFITMTRSDDTFVSLEDRVKITNLVMPKAFVSVHINALESTNDIKGVETYFQTEQSKPLADAVHNSLYTSLGVPNRGVRKARFYVINHTTVPAILAEVGYISNKDEREKLISSDYQAKIAEALTQGVILYVSKNPETPANTVKTAPVINFNQSAGKGTTTAPTKSVAASLSGSGSNQTLTVEER